MNTTIIISVKNRHENAKYCLYSIAHCDPKPSEVIVVDFGSRIPVNSIAKRFKFVRVIRTENDVKKFHKARALNIGIKAAKTKFICVTDVDQIFQKNFFGVLNHTLEKNNKCFVKCITYFLNTANVLPDRPQDIMMEYFRLLKHAKKFGRKPFGEGNCNGVSRSWAVRVRGYDERYIGWGYEDSNFYKRARMDGFGTIWLKNTTMIHMFHKRNPNYFHMPSIRKSLKMFTDTPQPLIANEEKEWGKV